MLMTTARNLPTLVMAVLVAGIFLGTATIGDAFAFFDVFIKIDTIPGESTDDKHKDWIEVQSFSHSINQPSSATGSSCGSRAAQRADFSDFSVVKEVDSATPKLAQACVNGEHIGKVTLEICRAKGPMTCYFTIEMEDVMVTSHQFGGRNADATPTENVSFDYCKANWTYVVTDPKTGKPEGNLQGTWDKCIGP